MSIITKYRVILNNGFADLPSLQAASDYCALAGGLQVEAIEESIADLSAAEILAAADAQRKMQAQALLDKTDMAALRCLKAGIVFPAEWQAYVVDLRAVLSGNLNILPVQPPYPQGT